MNKFFRALTSHSNIGARLILSFGLLIAIVVCLGLLGLKHVRADVDLEESVAARWHKVRLSHKALDLSNLNNRLTMQVFLIGDENEVNSLLKQRATNSETISSLVDTLRSKVESAEETKLLDAIDKKRTPYTESYQRALQLLVEDKKPAEARTVMVEEALPRLLNYHAAWNAYVQYQGEQLNEAQSIATANHFTTRVEAFLLISLAIGIAIAIAYFVTRNLMSHMDRRKLAEEGLRQAHAELETRVQERTAQLEAMNENLQAEIEARELIAHELRDSEERYREIVNGATDMIYRLTPAGHFTFVNPAAAAAVKRSVDECVGLHFLSLVRNDFREGTIQFYLQQIRDKVPVSYFEFPVVVKDGTEIWVGQNVQLEIEDGEVVELQAVGRDITMRKEIEEQLLESERRYRMLFESNPQPMWVFDDETLAFLAVNDAAVRTYGYSREEFLGMTIKDIRPAEDIPALLESTARDVDGFSTYDPSSAWRHLKKDGSMIDVDISWHTLDFGGRPARLVRALDITERERAEKEILLQTTRFEQLFENAPLGIVRVDQNDIVVDANKGFEDIFQFSLDEMRGRHIDEIVVPKAQREEAAALSSRVLGGEVISLETFRRRKDGSQIPVQIYGVPIMVNEKPVGVFAIYVDLSERERAQEKIAQLAEIVESSDDAIIGKDLDGTITSWNRGARTLYGYRAEEVVGRSISMLIPPDRSSELPSILELIEKDQGVRLNETERLTKDGTRICVSLTISPIKDPSGRVVGASTISRDITERKRALEKIGQLAQIVESSHDAIIATDLHANIVSWNQGAERIYGYRAEEILGKHISLLAPADRQEEISQRKQRLESESDDRIAPYEAERLRKDGQRIQVSVSLSRLRDAGGRVLGGSIIARDITERKRMEEERQAIFDIIQGVNMTDNLEELFGLIHTSIGKLLYAENCFVALHDPATDFIHFPFWVDKLDPCPPPRPVGIGFSSYVLRTGKPILVDPELTEQMYQRGEIVKSGTASASWLGVPLRTPTHTIGVLVVQHYEVEQAYDERDLEFLESVGNQVAIAIERKRAETNLRETEEQLRQSQKMESIGTLAGGIAHDFNNLMTAVTGYSELALRSLEHDSPLRAKIEEIKKAGDRAASLTRQLLAFSRKQILQPRVLDLNTVVKGMGQMLPRMIGEDIDLRIELSTSLGQLKADPSQIEQVLMNLAVNARDAMPEGGRLTIKTENVRVDGKFGKHRSVVEQGQYVVLSVSDNGFGMDAETQAHIFEPFFTTKEVGKGTGLGLSTVYGIVKQSGGSVWVYSEVGRGTIFKIYLPRIDEIVEAVNFRELRPVPRGHETILLVEDEEVVRDLSKEILEEYGYAVIAAANGKEGLRICKEFEGRIDLMITDVVMPEMSGQQLAENISALRPDTRVLYMSGFTDDAIVRHGVRDEGLFFLQKPFSPDSLALKAREVLDHCGSSLTDGEALIPAQGGMTQSETIRRS